MGISSIPFQRYCTDCISEMTTVLCSLECLQLLLDGIKETKYVKYIILLKQAHESIPDDLRQQIHSLPDLKCLDFKDLVSNPGDLRPIAPADVDAVNTVCFTSGKDLEKVNIDHGLYLTGTTGNPKGVLLTHKNVVSCTAGIVRGPIANDVRITSVRVCNRMIINLVLCMERT